MADKTFRFNVSISRSELQHLVEYYNEHGDLPYDFLQKVERKFEEAYYQGELDAYAKLVSKIADRIVEARGVGEQ